MNNIEILQKKFFNRDNFSSQHGQHLKDWAEKRKRNIR